ncbi:GMC family oxidoreductase [Shewanella sp. 3_MG-2023]|uniref:GMC family oxidoreductase N-terminal domain-containing protein n=1 Tax=Shewanella sp. 3_MG-2023 TaxID=3062635 RepID=UPI0026E4128A|nr:GMC family oxidoreductase [Shewanella sp. 3_MG-2023]MDO6775622.1 GMC family oxidoreductase [Shewanella sp. 3_MG-2023]
MNYDVIVVGSGMSGGIAAKEFCEKGYKTLVLDRGEPIEHGQYKTEGLAPWQMAFRGEVLQEFKLQQHIQKNIYIYSDFTKHHLINDLENPYIQKQPFIWYRSATVGGKSLIWGRQSYRWCEQDFKANKQDGYGVDWPIRYRDIAPWYDYIEPFVGISGSYENLPQLPDGKFLPPQPLNVVERDMKAKVEEAFPERKFIPARMANLTQASKIHTDLGRGQCQARSECPRGCSFGGYYSSNSAALPAAKRTGNLTLIANAQVQEVLYDDEDRRATGVRYVDNKTGKSHSINAKVVFMCASTLGSIQILLNSKSTTFPNGIGNRYDILGRYIMDHCGGGGASGKIPGYLDDYYKGRRPGGVYIPRFRNLENTLSITKSTNNQTKNGFLRGYGFQGGASRSGWQWAKNGQGIGADFKAKVSQPGNWYFSMWGFGEVLPRYENRVTLHPTKTDLWGLPLLVTDVTYQQNEINMVDDMTATAVEILTAAGLEDIKGFEGYAPPGGAIHEMGGCCMGVEAKTSYLNKWNQCHEVANLFVTDGAAFSSTSCVNPSITFMAMTARAVDYADKQLKAGLL